jgi:hypothetical protein
MLCDAVVLLQLLKFAQDLSIDEVEISDTGCLGEPGVVQAGHMSQVLFAGAP